MQIAGIILAGGQGRRMGGADKALIPLGDMPLIGHAVARLGPQVGAMAISANGDPARLAEWGLPVLADEDVQGPLSGVLAGMRWASGFDAIVTVAVDTPFFPLDLVTRLAAVQAPVVMAETAGDLHPTFALWPVSAADQVAAFLASGESPRVTTMARQLGMARVPFAYGDFHNINTPDDLLQAVTRLA